MTSSGSPRVLAGRRILALTRYGEAGPSSRMRFHLYADALRGAGAEIAFAPLFGDGYVETLFRDGRKDSAETLRGYARRLRDLLVARADLVWVEKELFPFLPGPFERALRWRGLRYVVDYDDAIFHNYDLAARGAVRRLLGRKLDPLLGGAALVTAGNAYLADYARAHGAAEAIVLPTVVDLDRYPVRPPPGGDRLRVGWIGTPGNARYLAPVVAALNRVDAHTPVSLVTVGAGAVEGLRVPHERLEWSREREGDLVASFDIGVMPLVDSPWERGKCGYKLIQYMAAARPVIASPVGVNPEIVTPAVGMLADGVDEWAAAIATLAEDGDRRRAMGSAARDRVARHYALAATAPVLVDAFARLLGTRAGADRSLAAIGPEG